MILQWNISGDTFQHRLGRCADNPHLAGRFVLDREKWEASNDDVVLYACVRRMNAPKVVEGEVGRWP